MNASTRVTAKVELRGKKDAYNGKLLDFVPDYGDGRNAEWAAATPSLSLTMTVREDVAEHFDMGEKYTLTFSKEVTDGDSSS